MRLKIISDGTPYGSKIIDSDTGEMVEMVRHIDITLGVGGVSATIEIINPLLDLHNITPEVV